MEIDARCSTELSEQEPSEDDDHGACLHPSALCIWRSFLCHCQYTSFPELSCPVHEVLVAFVFVNLFLFYFASWALIRMGPLPVLLGA